MGFTLEEHPRVEECRRLHRSSWPRWGVGSHSPQAADRGPMSVSRHWSPGGRRAGSIPGLDTPRTIPSACTGLLTGSDSCESTPAPVAGETGVKQGGKHCNYLLTRFHISLLSEWFCFLIYFDLLEN